MLLLEYRPSDPSEPTAPQVWTAPAALTRYPIKPSVTPSPMAPWPLIPPLLPRNRPPARKEFGEFHDAFAACPTTPYVPATAGEMPRTPPAPLVAVAPTCP